MKKPRLSRNTIEKLYTGEHVVKGKYEYYIETEWNEGLNEYEDRLYRKNNETYGCDSWTIGWEGL